MYSKKFEFRTTDVFFRLVNDLLGLYYFFFILENLQSVLSNTNVVRK